MAALPIIPFGKQRSAKAGHRSFTARSKARAPSRSPVASTKEARREASSDTTSLRARSARLRALSLGMPALSNRPAFSSSLTARSMLAA